ncbi:MAG: hypothetical protein ACXVEE_02350 [Polyangiales bacterium]
MAHRWRFFRAGGFDQVQLDRGEDLVSLGELDQKLWVALSCPVSGLELDEKTLAMIDTDKDGRIRAPEIIAAAKWAGTILADPEVLIKGGDSVALSSISEAEGEPRTVYASARQILIDLGKQGEPAISLADVTDTAKIFAQTRFNGDGIVPAASSDDDVIKKTIEEIVDCVGGETDRCGAPGVSTAKLETFFTEAKAFDAWWKRAEADPAVLPIGERTTAAADAVRAVKLKVDDWFTRSKLAAFDPRAVAPLNRDEAEYATLAPKMLSAKGEEIASFPLARVEPSGSLTLERGINPAWTDAMRALRTDAIVPLLGERATLDETGWSALLAKLAPFEAWRAEKAGAQVEKLGLARVREILGGGAQTSIEALIAKDKALEPEANAIASVEKIVRLQRDLHRLLNNFVSFSDFYSRKRKAVFQAGTLFLDQRSCDLCIRVADAGGHAVLATLSKTYLAYCDCTRKSDGKKMVIAAAFTDGDSDQLLVGRNGIFYDRQGADWDATIVKIVEHPISVREAFWLPYKRVGKLINTQIEKIASARDKEMHDKAAANVEGAGAATTAPAPTPTAPQQAFDVARFAGIFAAIGLAVGALGSALAAVATGFLQLRWWQMPLVFAGMLLLISGPSMIIAWLKLRQRSLAPILDANGWAVNARAKMNIPFGRSLTAMAELPQGAERSLVDPFAEKKRPWLVYFLLLVIACGLVAHRFGYTKKWLERFTPHAAAPR